MNLEQCLQMPWTKFAIILEPRNVQA